MNILMPILLILASGAILSCCGFERVPCNNGNFAYFYSNPSKAFEEQQKLLDISIKPTLDILEKLKLSGEISVKETANKAYEIVTNYTQQQKTLLYGAFLSWNSAPCDILLRRDYNALLDRFRRDNQEVEKIARTITTTNIVKQNISLETEIRNRPLQSKRTPEQRSTITTEQIAYRNAAISGNIETINYLLKNGSVGINDVVDKESKYTALHYAVQNKQLETVRLLLSKGANINLIDQWGRAPKVIALDNKYFDIADLLTTINKE